MAAGRQSRKSPPWCKTDDVERKAREAKLQCLVPAHNLELVVCTQWKPKTIGETLAAENGKGPVKT